MEPKDKTCRRGPALAAAAAFGLATTAMLAPAAHASTEVDRPEEFSSAQTVGADSVEVADVIGAQPVVEAGTEVVVEADEGVAGDAGALPSEAEAIEETTIEDNSDLDDRCGDGSTEEQQSPAAIAPDTAAAATGLDEGFADEGPGGEAGLSDTVPVDDGDLTSPECGGTTPGQVDEEPGSGGEEQAQLPVGGVDAGIGEATSQNIVLPIATAGAAAAAIGLGAYTLVRRGRSNA